MTLEYLRQPRWRDLLLVGAVILGTASPSKHEALGELGVHHCIDSRGADLEGAVRRLTDGRVERHVGDAVVIATGGYPAVPDIPGAELGITSDDFFELEQRPQRVLIAGSGYVAVELGGVFAHLGSATQIGSTTGQLGLSSSSECFSNRL